MRKFLPILCLFALSCYALADDTAAETEPKEETRFRAPKHSVVSAFAQSFSSILVSEIGDKTFFIAAIMAMRYNRIAVLLGALFALLLMTILSTAFGWIVPVLLPPHVTHIAITVLFFFFGVKLLYDSYHHEEGENDEQAEVEQELNQVHSKLVKTTSPPRERRETEIQYIIGDGKDDNTTKEETSLTISTDLESESNGSQAQPVYKKDVKTNYLVSKKLVFWQALTLTFLGEWGDRSQITTIALAAEGNPLAVCVGSFLGHCLCTSLAVVGGKFLAKKISERTVNISGGILFLLFGFHNLFAAEA